MVFCCKLDKVIVCSIKSKRSSHDNNEGKSVFQTTAIELYKEQKKEHLKLVISSIRVGVVAKAYDEVYVLSAIKIYSYFSFVFSTVTNKIEFLKISKVI